MTRFSLRVLFAFQAIVLAAIMLAPYPRFYGDYVVVANLARWPAWYLSIHAPNQQCRNVVVIELARRDGSSRLDSFVDWQWHTTDSDSGSYGIYADGSVVGAKNGRIRQ